MFDISFADFEQMSDGNHNKLWAVQNNPFIHKYYCLSRECYGKTILQKLPFPLKIK